MKNFILIIGLFCTLTCWGGTPGNAEKYLKFVDSVARQYQIPSDLIFGVGICESGFGTSSHAKRLNNYFGIRGKYSKVHKTSYRFYEKPEDSIVAFCELVARKNFYAKLKGNPDPMVWVKALAKAKYAANGRVWTKLVKRAMASFK
jgi:flagellum-specific peptidoglycan hydrolase FlgJ